MVPYDLEPLAPGRCGCLHGNTILPDGRRAYVIKPCSPTCEFYVYAQRETARQGNPIQFRSESQ